MKKQIVFEKKHALHFLNQVKDDQPLTPLNGKTWEYEDFLHLTAVANSSLFRALFGRMVNRNTHREHKELVAEDIKADFPLMLHILRNMSLKLDTSYDEIYESKVTFAFDNGNILPISGIRGVPSMKGKK